MTDILRAFEYGMTRHLGRNIGFNWTVDPVGLRTADMARSEIEAVLLNLYTNAVKAVDQEGVDDKRIRVKVRPDSSGENIVLRFQDSGVGIDRAIRDRIFDPFFTTSPVANSELGTGTGLGLKIVRDVLEEHGGDITLSVPDPGYSTCFEVTIPRWKSQYMRDGGSDN
jgi:signal transduction histidine kinase